MKPNPIVDSALHVLKGAVQAVLSATVTTSVYAEDNKGRLTVEFSEKPTEQQMEEIEKLANNKVQENAAIEMFEIGRKEAEAKYGNIIYDRFQVPSHIQTLSLTMIKGWNINCCLGPHVKTTGEIGKIKILKYRARPSRNELEISFEVIAQ